MKSKIPPKMMKKVLKNRKSSSKGVKKLTPQKEQKVVAADNLNWKPVEIPDTLDDFGGFYGLEEIDGVDVKVVNGQVEFITRNEDNIKDKVEETTDIEMKTEEDDEEDGKSKEKKKPIKETKEDKKTQVSNLKKLKKAEDKKEQERGLQSSGFQSLVELPDEVDLPEWSKDELSLSTYTLQGLQMMEFLKPTPIQKRTIPLAMSGKDIVGKAMTGSGKTYAYGIPILEKYLSNYQKQVKGDKPRSPSGVIFAPTRELAHQVVKHLEKLARYSPLTVNGILSITGGLSIQKQERLLERGPGIIVATPGRMLELLEKNSVLAARLASTDIIVFDEADRLLQDGHFEELEKIIDVFTRSRPKELENYKWQTLVFSATFSKELFGKLTKKTTKNSNNKKPHSKDEEADDEILKLLSTKLKFKDKNPSLIDANPKETVAGKITEALIECGAVERDLYLYYFLLMYPGTTLVFANSIDSVKRLAPFLNNLNIPSFSIHSQMIQKQRLRSLERFTKASETNKTAVLIASDVAARGLDIPNITHVVHYHLPRSADVYIHRSGRTARAGKEGVSVMICSPQEASGPLKKLRKLIINSSNLTKLNAHSDVKMLPIEGDIVAQLKPRVKLAAELSDAIISTDGSTKELNWVIKAAEELGIDDLSDMEEDDYLKRTRKRKEKRSLEKTELLNKRYELKQMLDAPIRKDMRRSYLTGGLNNLADFMLKGDSHNQIVGHSKVNALDDLRVKKKIGKKAKK